MPSIVFTAAELEALGHKLGTIDDRFTAEERALLRGILDRGIAGLHEDAGDDVTGFAFFRPSVRKVRDADDRHPTTGTGAAALGTVQVELGEPATLPLDQITLDFTKL